MMSKQFAVRYHQGLKNTVADTDGVCFTFLCLKELLFVGTFQVLLFSASSDQVEDSKNSLIA